MRNRTNGFTSCFLGGMVFRFCGFGKTFHESENPVSLFETGRLIRFLVGRLSGLSHHLSTSHIVTGSVWLHGTTGVA